MMGRLRSGIMIDAARVCAFSAHGATGQKRKYTGDPYFNHCERVAELVASVQEADVAMIAAAYLHDVVEDTDLTVSDIGFLFGPKIATYVEWLTDVPLSFGNRAQRKALDRERLSLAPGNVKTIKLADLIDNTSTIVKHDPAFAAVYLPEKRLLLEVLVGGDAGLMELAGAELNTAEQALATIRTETKRAE